MTPRCTNDGARSCGVRDGPGRETGRDGCVLERGRQGIVGAGVGNGRESRAYLYRAVVNEAWTWHRRLAQRIESGALLKRGLKGTYISVEPEHQFRFVDERVYIQLA